MSSPFIPIPNTAQVELIFSLAGDVLENTFHVKSNTPFTSTLLTELRVVFDTWHNASMRPALCNDIILQRIRSRALDSSSAPVEDYHLATPRAGGVGANSMPPNVTLAIKLATALAGRSYRGRIYWPGIYAAALSAPSVMGSPYQTVIQTALNALQPALTAHNAAWTLCVGSRYTGGAWRTTGVCTPATGWVIVNGNLDSQRRRLLGRGHP